MVCIVEVVANSVAISYVCDPGHRRILNPKRIKCKNIFQTSLALTSSNMSQHTILHSEMYMCICVCLQNKVGRRMQINRSREAI